MTTLRSLPPARGSEAFTLIEVMVSLGVLAVGLLAMLAMQVSAMQAGRTGRDVTEAARIAQDQMEFLHRIAWDDPDAQPTAWTATTTVQGLVSGPGAPGGQPYDVQWRIQATGDPNLRLLDVRVTWTDPNQSPGAPLRRYAVSGLRHNDP